MIGSIILVYYITQMLRQENTEINIKDVSSKLTSVTQISDKKEMDNPLSSNPPTTYKVEIDLADDYVYESGMILNRLTDKDFRLKAESLCVVGYNVNTYNFDNMKLVCEPTNNKLILTAQQPTRGDFTKIRFLMYLVRAAIDGNYKKITGTYTGWYGSTHMSMTIGKS